MKIISEENIKIVFSEVGNKFKWGLRLFNCLLVICIAVAIASIFGFISVSGWLVLLLFSFDLNILLSMGFVALALMYDDTENNKEEK